MAYDSSSAISDSLQFEAYGLYHALTLDDADFAVNREESEANLGGRLLYAGELDAHGRAMVIAGNVAGCGTLAATDSLIMQKQAVRDGVVDFLVNSLDEALRILKNEIRKRAAVAVCVGVAPSTIEHEMTERGLLPDLVFGGSPGEQRDSPHFGPGARRIELNEPRTNQVGLTWHVAQAPARWMAKLDEIALDCLVSDWRALRWIRLSPRYSGRSAQAQRAIYCDPESARQIVGRFTTAVREGQIKTEVSASVLIGDATNVYRLLPVITD